MANSEHHVSTDGIVADLSPDGDIDFGERICVLHEREESVQRFCDHIRHSLMSHPMVFHPFAGDGRVQSELLKERSQVRQILAKDFHRLVVLDVNRALDSEGNFDLARFYQYTFEQLSHTFGIPLTETYHEEDMVQILRDEPKSLICLLNVHRASSPDRKSLRSLTQEGHQTLIVYRSSRASSGSDSTPRPFLTALRGPVAGQQYELPGPTCVLGRHPDCDIVIEVPRVSREHAQLICKDTHCFLEDLESRNGTYLNEAQVQGRQRLYDGDVLRICDVSFIVRGLERRHFRGPL